MQRTKRISKRRFRHVLKNIKLGTNLYDLTQVLICFETEQTHARNCVVCGAVFTSSMEVFKTSHVLKEERGLLTTYAVSDSTVISTEVSIPSYERNYCLETTTLTMVANSIVTLPPRRLSLVVMYY